jgi:hypothetical protein
MSPQTTMTPAIITAMPGAGRGSPSLIAVAAWRHFRVYSPRRSSLPRKCSCDQRPRAAINMTTTKTVPMRPSPHRASDKRLSSLLGSGLSMETPYPADRQGNR